MYGDAISDKGMALFPEKVNGKYVMISRQGGEKINIMYSDDLYVWNEFQTLMEPLHPWELVQLGNCGSPIKTDKGWLLLTHGVGTMRTYVISAILLDLNDPSIILGRLNKPILEADDRRKRRLCSQCCLYMRAITSRQRINNTLCRIRFCHLFCNN